MSNDLIEKEGDVPAWMKLKSTGAVIGNLSADDIKPPEIKLLQATSPETAEQPGAKAGEFWLTGANINLGPEIIGTPIIVKRTFIIWNPTKSVDFRGPLATASDGIRWDIPDQTFEVKYPNNQTVYTWRTKRTVAESGLGRFGSSQPENPRSTPAASETYQMLWAVRLPDGRPQLGVITNSRSGIKPIRELFGMMDGHKPIDFYFLRFRICAVRVQARPGEYFFGYKYFYAGRVQSEAEGDAYQAMHERYKKAGFSSAISEDADLPSPPPARAYAGSDAHLSTTRDDDEIPF